MAMPYPSVEGTWFKLVEDDYCVGDDGSVWSRKKGDWVRLRPSILKHGHRLVKLSIGGRACHRYVHRLVIEAFVGPCPVGMECRHLDGDAGNNRIENLEWGTRRENYADAIRHGTAPCLTPEFKERTRNMWRSSPQCKKRQQQPR